MYPLPAFLTLLPLILLTTEKNTGCANQTTKGVNKAPRNPS